VNLAIQQGGFRLQDVSEVGAGKYGPEVNPYYLFTVAAFLGFMRVVYATE